MLRKKQYPVYFILPGIFLFVMFFIVPFLVGFRYSFTNWNFKRADFIGLENYIRAFTAGGFLKQLKNTLIYIAVAVSFETAIGLLFALFLE